jgi:hypothetical protein
VGGGGNDRLFGSDLGDGLFPGGGQDRVEGGGGNEYIVSFDGMKDVIDCGPGRDDFNVIDHHDRLHRCGDREFGDPFSDFKQRLRLPFAP